MIQRIVSTLVGLLFVAAVFVFTSLLVAIAVAAGLVLAVWAWWRGWGVQQRGRVIEGESRVVEGEHRVIESR
jgi:hypothetical protein